MLSISELQFTDGAVQSRSSRTQWYLINRALSNIADTCFTGTISSLLTIYKEINYSLMTEDRGAKFRRDYKLVN